MVPLVMAILYAKDILPGPVALAFSISDFGGFLWTLAVVAHRRPLRPQAEPSRADRPESPPRSSPSRAAWSATRAPSTPTAGCFSAPSARSIRANPSLARAARQLEGAGASAHRHGSHEEGHAALAGGPYSRRTEHRGALLHALVARRDPAGAPPRRGPRSAVDRRRRPFVEARLEPRDRRIRLRLAPVRLLPERLHRRRALSG